MEQKRTLRLRHSGRKRRTSKSDTAGLNVYTRDIWNCIQENLSERTFITANIKELMVKKYTDSQYTYAIACLEEEGKVVATQDKKNKQIFYKVKKNKSLC